MREVISINGSCLVLPLLGTHALSFTAVFGNVDIGLLTLSL